MEIIDTELTAQEIADRLAGKMQHTGPVTLVIAPDRTTEREKRSRSYGNAYSRYKHLDIASSGDFPDIETASAGRLDHPLHLPTWRHRTRSVLRFRVDRYGSVQRRNELRRGGHPSGIRGHDQTSSFG